LTTVQVRKSVRLSSKSQTTLNIILQADLTERFCDLRRSANSLPRDPLHGTLEQNWRVHKTAEHQRLVEASIRQYTRKAIRVMGRHPNCDGWAPIAYVADWLKIKLSDWWSSEKTLSTGRCV